MYDYRDFDLIFEEQRDFAYSQKEITSIEANRKQHGKLFIDRVLHIAGNSGSVKKHNPINLYPPKSNDGMRKLHQLITESAATEHVKLSVLFYLLLDTGGASHLGQAATEAAAGFATEASLPQKHQTFMRGLWHMDHGHFDSALQYLTHPSLLPTFHDEILEALIRQARHDDYSLALAYYYTVSPTITSPQTMDSLFHAMACTSVTEAFWFMRQHDESMRVRFFNALITSVLAAKQADNAIELIGLPLNHIEEAWFEACLTTGPARQHKRAKDTLLMRKMALGRYSEAMAIDDVEEKPINGLSWGILMQGLQGTK